MTREGSPVSSPIWSSFWPTELHSYVLSGLPILPELHLAPYQKTEAEQRISRTLEASAALQSPNRKSEGSAASCVYTDGRGWVHLSWPGRLFEVG
jgi:hypothetical protein